jgi:hypothetical protein
MKEMKGVKAMKKRIPANPLPDLHCLHDLQVCFLARKLLAAGSFSSK